MTSAESRLDGPVKLHHLEEASMKQISRFAKSVCNGYLPVAVLMLLSCRIAMAAPTKLEIPSTLDFGEYFQTVIIIVFS